jgi:hypothetical protein
VTIGSHIDRTRLGLLARESVCMDLVFQIVTRNPEGLALCLAQEGRLRALDREGRVVFCARGLAEVAAFARTFHENVQLEELRVGEPRWAGEAFAFDWTCTARNWGSGPTHRTGGVCRGVVAHAPAAGLLAELDLVCDAQVVEALRAAAA